MKKNIIIICAFICIINFLSCEKWLNVQPVDRVTDESLFSKGIGFQTALNGIYQYISEGTLYGRNLSWGLYSALGQDYLNTDISSELQFAGYTFDHSQQEVLNLGTSIWSNAYRAIANSNKLIQEVEKADTSIFRLGKSEKLLIKGEAIALRGLLHFELLRLFAASPLAEPKGKYIPYVNTYPSYVNEPLETTTIISKIQSDLDEAKNLVSNFDTVLNKAKLAGKLTSRLAGSLIPEERFYTFRMMRMNYVAISGLMAKVALYAGDLKIAREASEYVYKTYGPHGINKWWEFTSSTNSSGTNKYSKLADDILFASYNADLISDIDAYKGTTLRFRLNREISKWFLATERDYRANYNKADASVSTDFLSDRWLLSSSTSTLRPQQNYIIPVLRMSEIYYIYSETLFKKGETVEALKVLNQIRNARGRITTFSAKDENSFYTELLNEYRREFLTEGQTIFAYKRLGKPMQIGTQIIPMDGRYTFEIPNGELIF